MANEDLPKWQDILHKIIQSKKELQRLATALGVNAITLNRWAKGESQPHSVHLINLVKLVQSDDREELLAALQIAYPDIQEKFQEESAQTIPAAFFRKILKDRATFIDNLRPWQLSANVIDEAIQLLDPYKAGMAITPVLCMPPVNHRIRSLREQGGRGTFPWTADLEHKSIFLGMNCLAGYVVQNNRPASVRNVQNEKYIPVFAHPENLEVSAAACPIWLEGKVAGCLLAASAKASHFTQARMDLLISFAHIFSLALNKNDFYEHSLIQLRYVPMPRIQHPYLKTFRQRVNQLMTASDVTQPPLSNVDAEIRAWQSLEEELLQRGVEMDEEEEIERE
jgi:hypothetical protein